VHVGGGYRRGLNIFYGEAEAREVHPCGIASNVELINFHALGQTGQGTDSSVINAITKAIELKNQYNIRVLNLSLGRAVYESYTQAPSAKRWRRHGMQASSWWWRPGVMVVGTTRC
jgi:serine protease AprX